MNDHPTHIVQKEIIVSIKAIEIDMESLWLKKRQVLK